MPSGVPAAPIPAGYHYVAGKGIVADDNPSQQLSIDDWKKYADTQTPLAKVEHWLPYIVGGVLLVMFVKKMAT